MQPLFDKNQQLDESEIVDSIANKAPRRHKAMLMSQGFNPETGDLETFLEHCERDEITDNIVEPSFLPQTRTVTPRDTKSVPISSMNVRTMVRNTVIKILTVFLSPWF